MSPPVVQDVGSIHRPETGETKTHGTEVKAPTQGTVSVTCSVVLTDLVNDSRTLVPNKHRIRVLGRAGTVEALEPERGAESLRPNPSL